ncbi:hypothetical protein BV378_18585 [Nostoc sp. RF31YmG]|jgi:hypothetical protein|nr:hypothetical protein BV378_18585 [Nostoc sp. RF31YmG]
MARIPIGTKIFGAIKTIESTPLITQFFMIGYVPIIPIKSFYLLHEYEVERGLLSYKQEMRIINLKNISFLSVGFAYLRAFFIISAFFSIAYLLTSQRSSQNILIPIALFILSVTIIFLSYKLGQQISITEKTIRKAAYFSIGIAIDPAIIEEGIARNISDLLDLELKKNGCNDWKFLLEEILQNTSLFKTIKNKKYSTNIKNLLLVKIRAAIGSKEIKLNKALDLIQELLVEDISNQEK